MGHTDRNVKVPYSVEEMWQLYKCQVIKAPFLYKHRKGVPTHCVTFYTLCIISENQLLSTSMSCTSARTGYHIVHVLILINPAEQKWKVKRATVDENTRK